MIISRTISKDKLYSRKLRRKKATYEYSPIDDDILIEDVEIIEQSNINRGILTRWYYLYIKKLMGRIFLAFIIILILLYIYIVSVHRVKGLKELQIVIETMNKPLYNNRCRQYNETHFQCLPNVFLIGASKCGTTTLVDYLKEYPYVGFVKRRIIPDKHAEVHRFDRNTYGLALKEIDLADEWASSPIFSNPNLPIIHYTPHYLFAPTVPYEMKEFYPNPDELKFIVMLRNPIDRALSSYWFQNSHLFHDVDKGSITDFQKLMFKEMSERNAYEKCIEKALLNSNQLDDNGIYICIIRILKTLASIIVTTVFNIFSLLSSNNNREMINSNIKNETNSLQNLKPKLNYKALQKCYGNELRSPQLGHRHLDKGIYIDQIQRWWDNFPSKNFYFIMFDKFIENPKEEFEKLLDFINLDESKTKDIRQNHNDEIIKNIKFDKRRLYKPNSLSLNVSLPSTFKNTLENYYKPYNEKLEKLLNKSFNF